MQSHGVKPERDVRIVVAEQATTPPKTRSPRTSSIFEQQQPTFRFTPIPVVHVAPEYVYVKWSRLARGVPLWSTSYGPSKCCPNGPYVACI